MKKYKGVSQIKIVDDEKYKFHIERTGIPYTEVGLCECDLLPIIVAIYLCGDVICEKTATDEPTPEEMLAIGIAIGMREASLKHQPPPSVSIWKIASRLRI
jgi:hypothetical protein